MDVLGLDTSNYTTSAAVFNGRTGENIGRLLDVRPGELGLRQSDALFQHVKHLPELLEQLAERERLIEIKAVGASTRPRAVEGSYMPCFLAGESQGRGLAAGLGVPFYSNSHQQGHLAAAAWSAGQLELLDTPFLAWHLSGGTTELLLIKPKEHTVEAEVIGGTSDLSAGQLIDRTGVMLGLQFPAGKALDKLYHQAEIFYKPSVNLKNLSFSLSGMENQVKALLERGEEKSTIARFALDAVIDVVSRATQEAQRQYPGLPVLCSGGVASNTQLRARLTDVCGAIFAEPQYSTDNAMGTAILAWRALNMGEGL